MSTLLNLLPPEKKKALRQGLMLAFALSMTLVVFLVALSVTATIVSVRVLLANNYATLKAPVSGQDDYTDSATSIKQINTYVHRVEGYMNRSSGWTDRLIELSEVVPTGVVIDNMTFSGGKLIVRGYAVTRDDLLVYTERLSKMPFVSHIDSPLSNLLQKRDVRFELDMDYALDRKAK